jgi:hypothetical protein
MLMPERRVAAIKKLMLACYIEQRHSTCPACVVCNLKLRYHIGIHIYEK